MLRSKLKHQRVVGAPRIEDKKASVVAVAGVKGKPQQTAFVRLAYTAPQIEKDRRSAGARRQHADEAGLLDEEEAPAAVSRVGDEPRLLEAR